MGLIFLDQSFEEGEVIKKIRFSLHVVFAHWEQETGAELLGTTKYSLGF